MAVEILTKNAKMKKCSKMTICMNMSRFINLTAIFSLDLESQSILVRQVSPILGAGSRGVVRGSNPEGPGILAMGTLQRKTEGPNFRQRGFNFFI